MFNIQIYSIDIDIEIQDPMAKIGSIENMNKKADNKTFKAAYGTAYDSDDEV